MTKKTKKAKFDRLIEIQQELDEVKALYQEQEELLEELAEATEAEGGIFSCRAYTAEIVDQFASKSSVWKSTKVTRWKLALDKKGA